ncbi:MAG: gyrase subunit [Pseudomonadota bacterium]|jgi:DNA gyrase subunit A
MGVKAIELDDDDAVVAMAITAPDRQQVLAVCERGYGKRTALEEFRQQKRGGKGIILIDTSERNGPVVGLALVTETDEVMLVTNRGQMIRTRVAEIRETGRNAQGVRVMNVEADERVVAIEPVGESDDDEALVVDADATESSAAPSNGEGGVGDSADRDSADRDSADRDSADRDSADRDSADSGSTDSDGEAGSDAGGGDDDELN